MTSLITLGTAAGPALRTDRSGIATAVAVDDRFYLIDFGLGVTRAAAQAGLRGSDFAAGFITHLHSDHVVELPGFLLWNWGNSREGFTDKVRVLGPGPVGAADKDDATPAYGTVDLIRSVLAAYAYDIDVRVADEGRTPLDTLVDASDIVLPPDATVRSEHTYAPPMAPFLVYEDERVRVQAVLVDHPPVFPAFAFRIDADDLSIVVSGDTAECDNVARLAEGADLLVHEAVHLDFYVARGFSEQFVEHQRRAHTPPEGVGRIASAAGVPHVVLSHLAGVARDRRWIDGVRRTYGGQVTVARDGQTFQTHRRAGPDRHPGARQAAPGR